MLDIVVNMFSRRHPKRDATLAVTRIMNRFDMVRLSYDEGHSPDRRTCDERHVALGVWLFPCGPEDKAGDIDYSRGVPAVTHDLRSEGFGVMTPVRLAHEHFMIAAKDDDVWRFFRCHVRHNTAKPGGWYQLGVQVDRTLELDCKHRAAFREHVESIQPDTAQCETPTS